ncbi:copper ABC transporter ATP-binding protein [Gilvibacter sp. SZ-19]|jgi:Cu-processing system ATP-binding protein|uniref:ABC transporter ATP-binding protein n=1 Tax=unclassified Gilvibacter TaxID=2625242 RepID=UPI000B3C5210|nr:ABC transporter ATP-binding protein [Gilvibacter sp. SZ-19]ARV12264.1 copper ABC transporter ATP-binding protein [Gilvibacter sp. SZ-19]
MIQIQNLNKRFGKNQVLLDLNLQLEQGGITAILGPNGSGKTTLIKSILGMVQPNSGEIIINDKSISRAFIYRKQIDYLPQLANFPNNLRLREMLHMIKDLRNEPIYRDAELIKLFQLEPHLNKKLGQLSGGTRQKVNLTLSFMSDSPLIILDEPTSGLDPVSLIKLKELLISEKRAGKTILLSSHITSFVEEMADQIVFLLEGKIYFKGTIEQLKTESNTTNFEQAIAWVLNQQNV